MSFPDGFDKDQVIYIIGSNAQHPDFQKQSPKYRFCILGIGSYMADGQYVDSALNNLKKYIAQCLPTQCIINTKFTYSQDILAAISEFDWDFIWYYDSSKDLYNLIGGKAHSSE